MSDSDWADAVGDQRQAVEKDFHRVVIIGGDEVIPHAGQQRSRQRDGGLVAGPALPAGIELEEDPRAVVVNAELVAVVEVVVIPGIPDAGENRPSPSRSEEHTSELQSL